MVDTFLGIVPPNIIEAATGNKLLGLVFFSILFGYFLARLDPEVGKPVIGFWNGVFQVMMRMTEFDMLLAPIGVFGLAARTVAGRGAEFQLPAVFPGDYWLLATARPTPNAPVEFAAVRISVNGEDQKDLKITTAKAAAVSGRVEVEGAAGLPSNLTVVAAETDFELPSSGPPAPPASRHAPGRRGPP